MAEVVTFGECMAVVYPQTPVSLDTADGLTLDIGGAEANTAIRLCQLGHATRYVSRVGADTFGRRIRATLEAHGVDTAYLRTDPTTQTGVFFREWLSDGLRRTYYYRAGSAASRMEARDLDPAQFVGARLVHLTGITPAISQSCRAATLRVVELAQAAGAAISFDPNYRPALWSVADARATLLPLLGHADILLIGHEDALALFDTDDPDTIFAHAADAGIGITVLKQGEQGVTAQVEGRRISLPAYPTTVVDPVGAGDAFNAGFLAGWLRGADLEASLDLGLRLGAVAVASLGDHAGLLPSFTITSG